MSEEVIVRTATESDLEHLKKWMNDPYLLHFFPMCNEKEVEQAVKFWSTFLVHPSVFTATIEGTPVGMAILYLQPFKKLAHQCLFAIVVDKDFRNRGIGTKLILELFSEGKKRFNLEMIHLEVYKGNPARKLYQRLGFIEYGTHRRFLKEPTGQYYDMVMMYKLL